MMKLDQVLNTFGLMGFREVAAINFKPNGAEIVLTSGETLLFTVPPVKPVAPPVPVNHDVAYFTYPSSDGGMPLSRRVIVQEDVGGYMGWVRGWETTNDSEYKFKKFLKRRIPGYQYHNEPRYIQFRSEPITSEDRANLDIP